MQASSQCATCVMILFWLSFLSRADIAVENGESTFDEDKADVLKKLKGNELITRVMNRPEDCEIVAEKGDHAQIHYTGYLEDGTIFDSSVKLDKPPVSFTIGAGRVIPGWEEGVLGMCEGETRRIVIPPHLGYGPQGYPPVIPPDATLMFEATLVRLDKKNLKDVFTGQGDYMQVLKLVLPPAVVLYLFYYMYKRYQTETEAAKDMKRNSSSKKGRKRK